MARAPSNKPKAQKKVIKDQLVQVRVTREQKQHLTEAAAQVGLAVGPFMLMHTLKAITRGD